MLIMYCRGLEGGDRGMLNQPSPYTSDGSVLTFTGGNTAKYIRTLSFLFVSFSGVILRTLETHQKG